MSEYLGVHPVRWAIQLGTRLAIVVAAVALRMLVMVPDTYLLTGLQNGASYTIHIEGTSQHLPSEVVDMGTRLGESD